MTTQLSPKQTIRHASLLLATALSGCVQPTPRNLSIPSAQYANRIKREYAQANPEYRARLARETIPGDVNAPSRIHLTAAEAALDAAPTVGASEVQTADGQKVVTNLNAQDPAFQAAGFQTYESKNPNIRDYAGPLSLGEPGVSSSLWRETRALNLVRDVRAFQPMDLITIVVQETSEGKREADTDVKQDSTLSASIRGLLGIDDKLIEKNPKITSGDNKDLTDVLGADFSSDFKGEGETTRKGSLKGRISAMVVEVLPSGILRVEGEKILAVNNEDEIMVISGLVRPEDVTSSNEISSSKIANMRIDYFGQGTVGDAQVGGWVSRILRRLWPL